MASFERVRICAHALWLQFINENLSDARDFSQTKWARTLSVSAAQSTYENIEPRNCKYRTSLNSSESFAFDEIWDAN